MYHSDSGEVIKCQHCHSPVKIENEAMSSSRRRESHHRSNGSYNIDLDSPPDKQLSAYRRLSSDIEKTFDDIANRNHLRSGEKTSGDRQSITPVSVSSRKHQSRYQNSTDDNIKLVNTLVNSTLHDEFKCPHCSHSRSQSKNSVISNQESSAQNKAKTFGDAYEDLRSSLSDVRSSVDSVRPRQWNYDNSDEIAKRRPVVRPKVTVSTEDATKDAMDQYRRQRPPVGTIYPAYRDQYRVSPATSPTPDTNNAIMKPITEQKDITTIHHNALISKQGDQGEFCVHCNQYHSNGQQVDAVETSNHSLSKQRDFFCVHCNQYYSNSQQSEMETLRHSVSDLCLRLDELRASRQSDMNWTHDAQSTRSSPSKYIGYDRGDDYSERPRSFSRTSILSTPGVYSDNEEVISLRASLTARDRQVAQLRKERLMSAERFAQDKSRESSYEQALRNEHRLAEERLAQDEARRLKAVRQAQETAKRLREEQEAQEQALRNERRLVEEKRAIQDLKLLKAEQQVQEQALQTERRLVEEKLAIEELNRLKAERQAHEQALENERRLVEEKRAIQELKLLKAEQQAQDEALKNERRLIEEKKAIEELNRLKQQQAEEFALEHERHLAEERLAMEELNRLKAERQAQEEVLRNERRLEEDHLAYEELQRLRAERHTLEASNPLIDYQSMNDTATRAHEVSPQRQLTSLAQQELTYNESESSYEGSLRNKGRLTADRLAAEELKQLEVAALENAEPAPLINIRRRVGKPEVEVPEVKAEEVEPEPKVEILKPPSASVWLDSGDLAFTHSFGPGNMGLRFEFNEAIGLNLVTEVKGVAATYGIRIGDYIVQTNEQDLAGYDNFSNGFEGVEVVLEAANALVEGAPGVFSLSDEALCEVLLELSRPLVITFVRPCDRTKLYLEERQEKARLLAEEAKLKEQKRLAEEEKRILEEAARLERERIAAEEQEAEYEIMKAQLAKKNALKAKLQEEEAVAQKVAEEEKEALERKKANLEQKVRLEAEQRYKLEKKRVEEPEHKVHFHLELAETEEEVLMRKERQAREEADLKYKQELEAQILEHERQLQEEIEKQKLEDERYARELKELEEKKQARLEEERQARKMRLLEEKRHAREEEARRAKQLKELEERERRAFELMQQKSARERSELEKRLLREKAEEHARELELQDLKAKEERALKLMQKKLDRDRAALGEQQEQERLEEEQRVRDAHIEEQRQMKLQQEKIAAEKESRAFRLMKKKRERDKAAKAAKLELEELKAKEKKALELMQKKLKKDKAAKLAEQRLEEERRAEEARLEEEREQQEREAELMKEREARALELMRRKKDRDKANQEAKLERARLKQAAAAELAVAKEQKRKLKEQRKQEALELERKRQAEEEEAKRKLEEEKQRELEEEENIRKADKAKALMLRKLRGNRTVKSVPKSSHSRSSQQDFSRLKFKHNSMRLDMIRGLAELRRPLTSNQVKNIDLTSKLVYMWPLEDGNKLTEEVKPWPCKVLKASMVKLTMPCPCGRTYAENEKAWGLVFESFLNTPGTPYRSQIKYTEDRKLTVGTSYLASSQEAHVIRVPKGGPRDSVDVEYLTDTNGKAPIPGDQRTFAALRELDVPIAKIFSKEENQEIFVGASVRVTKVVQRTFEFVDSAAAYKAMATLLKNTPKRDETEYGSDTDSETSKFVDSDDSDSDSDDSESSIDERFGLVHGGCRFKASRPLKVMLEGLEDYHLLLPDTTSVRIASADDKAPQEQPFPKSSCWGSQVDPVKVTRWDPKVLKEEGMPLRFVNHRQHCSVVYKVCKLVDIDRPEAPPITAAQTAKFEKRNPKRLTRAESFGRSHRDMESDVVMDLSSGSSTSKSKNEYFHEPLVVYVRPGETAWVKAPPGVYHLRLCEGRKWFGDEYKFGPSGVTLKPEAAKVVKGQPPPEPFANYVLSLWRYPNLWLYRSRIGRWLITPEDPSVAITPHDEAPKDDEEEERLRDLYINDVGTFRTKKKKLEWPHDEITKGNWEQHKGASCAPVESEDENAVFKMFPLKLWSPFKGLSITVDKEAYSVGSPRSFHRNNTMDPHAGPAAFWVSGLPSIVEDKGAFLRVAHRSCNRQLSEEATLRQRQESRESFSGLSSLEKPFRIHDKPVFRFDPRYDFLRGLFKTPELDEYDDEANHDEEILERGRAGPNEGAWWLDMRDSCHDAGTFAKEVLEEIQERGGEDSNFFSTWSASIFEVPDKRIRTVLWPQNS